MSTHITNGPSFIWGITGVSVPGYRVEERAGEWAVAVASNGREYLITKTGDGHLLHRRDVIKRIGSDGVLKESKTFLTGEVVEVSAT